MNQVGGIRNPRPRRSPLRAELAAALADPVVREAFAEVLAQGPRVQAAAWLRRCATHPRPELRAWAEAVLGMVHPTPTPAHTVAMVKVTMDGDLVVVRRPT